MSLLFLRSDIGKKVDIGGLMAYWHGEPWDEVDGVGAALTVVLDALGETVELLCIGCIQG